MSSLDNARQDSDHHEVESRINSCYITKRFNSNININICSIELKWVVKKLKYDMKTI